jgi:hypothetical protein
LKESAQIKSSTKASTGGMMEKRKRYTRRILMTRRYTMMRLIHPRQSVKQFKIYFKVTQQIALLISMRIKRVG